jgi:membrane fusion protein, multidrug efflux system
MNSIELQQDGSAGSQRNGEQPAVLHAPERETGFAPGHETVGYSPAISPMHDNAGEKSASTPSAKSRRIAGAIIPLSIIGSLLLGFLPRWRQRRTADDATQPSIPIVSIVSPTPLKLANGLLIPAEILPWREASIYARVNGYLKNWLVDIGTHVKAGQLLAEIETPNLNQQFDKAEAQLVLAQAEVHLAETEYALCQERLKSAYVSPQDAAEKAAAREIAVANVYAERANVGRLQKLVSFQRVVAPFAGTITKRGVDIGDRIVANSDSQELFHIAQTRKLRVFVRLPTPYALGIVPGLTATLTTLASPGRVFAAKVITVSKPGSSRVLLTELEVDNSQHQILPYSDGEISFNTNNPSMPLTLPANTLLLRGRGLQVGVVNADGTVELRSVQIGRNFGETVEILGGVTPSDRVIANPTDSLVNGAKVRIETVVAKRL